MSESASKARGGWLIATVAGVAAFSAAYQLFHAPLIPSLLWGLLFFFILMFLFSLPVADAPAAEHLDTAKPTADLSGATDAVLSAPPGSVAAQPTAGPVIVAPVMASAPVAAPMASPVLAPATPIATVYAAPAGDGRRPEKLNAPRGGKADDLTIIKGIGPKLEKLCFDLGFYHFDQLASWTSDEVIWVDVNLEGFKGRVTRDNWVGQARAIVELGPEEFLKQLAEGKQF